MIITPRPSEKHGMNSFLCFSSFFKLISFITALAKSQSPALSLEPPPPRQPPRMQSPLSDSPPVRALSRRRSSYASSLMEIDDNAPEFGLITTPPSQHALLPSHSQASAYPPSVTIDLSAPKGGKRQQMRNKIGTRQPPPSPDVPIVKGKGRTARDPQSDDETELPTIGNTSVILPNFDGADDDEYLDIEV